MKLNGSFFQINMVFGFQIIKMHGIKKSPNKVTEDCSYCNHQAAQRLLLN
jgi:hypothetical protein